MKPIVLVSKCARAFFTRDAAHKNSANAEQGDTEGLIRYLVSRGDLRVIYFGRYIGDPIPGLEVIQAHTQGLNEWNGALQEENWRKDIEVLEQYAPFACIFAVNGGNCGWSYINNPYGVNPQSFAVSYYGPVMNAIRHFRIPRIAVNNDPRSYMFDREAHLMHWRHTMPCALLDQWERDSNRECYGLKLNVRSVYAACESWLYCPEHRNSRERSSVCIAHAHIKDGCKVKGREVAWQAALNHIPEDMKVYGNGWEHYSHYDPNIFLGCISPSEVIKQFRSASCCPMVALKKGFATGKPYLSISQGCVPLFYGDGYDPLTYDIDERILPIDDPCRFTYDLDGAVEKLNENYDHRLSWWKEVLKPRYEKIDRLIEAIVSGDDRTSDTWWQEFGGYRAR